MDRRAALKTAGKGALGLAAGSALTSSFARRAAARDRLVFLFWPFGSEIVQSNVEAFNGAYGEDVDARVIGGDYPAMVETQLATDAHVDMFYSGRGQISRWYAAGWVRPIDDLPGFEQIRSEMQPGVAEDSKAPDGKFMALTYYNGGPCCLYRNEKVLGEGGYEATTNPADYPQTWEDVANICRDLKKKGISEFPLLMNWNNGWGGVPWNLFSHCYSEGEFLVDDGMNGIFDENTPLVKVLTDWKQWWDEGLVPQGILTMQEGPMNDAWVSGKHAFHPFQDYQVFSYGDKAGAVGPYNNMNPVMPGATHDTVLVGHAFVALRNRERSEEDLLRAWKLAQFFGYKNEKGEYGTHKKWVMKANLQVPFESIYQDPEAKAAVMKWMHPAIGETQYQWQNEGRARAKACNMLKAPWYEEWGTPMHDMVSNDLLLKGDVTPKDLTRKLRDLWDKLQKKYT
ncbi:MAG: extracellular solute-binding protein [Alphaproteobacteria bacterium]|nr:extracellular solute-binding protein [Alphaproteobacteria bacterium]